MEACKPGSDEGNGGYVPSYLHAKKVHRHVGIPLAIKTLLRPRWSGGHAHNPRLLPGQTARPEQVARTTRTNETPRLNGAGVFIIDQSQILC